MNSLLPFEVGDIWVPLLCKSGKLSALGPTIGKCHPSCCFTHMGNIMWCPHRGSWTSVVYALIWRMVWEELYFSSLSLVLKYFLPRVAWTSWAGEGKSTSYFSPPSPFPNPIVSMVEPAIAAAKENKAFSYLEGIPLWTSKVYSKQWSWNSFANKRSQEFFIMENIRLPTGRGCFQLTNTTHACKYISFWLN